MQLISECLENIHTATTPLEKTERSVETQVLKAISLFLPVLLRGGRAGKRGEANYKSSKTETCEKILEITCSQEEENLAAVDSCFL